MDYIVQTFSLHSADSAEQARAEVLEVLNRYEGPHVVRVASELGSFPRPDEDDEVAATFGQPAAPEPGEPAAAEAGGDAESSPAPPE